MIYNANTERGSGGVFCDMHRNEQRILKVRCHRTNGLDDPDQVLHVKCTTEKAIARSDAEPLNDFYYVKEGRQQKASASPLLPTGVEGRKNQVP
ncbi:hypothetical protein [Cesiribacter sp. SM1]|uniref:hypothetical protein n=1 Tax=Cesiribacter sp. SM1 TaxID=2861196 RepID=UPI001CD49619|nr:hypothetical protein [Cesiribacter sp. SM1]